MEAEIVEAVRELINEIHCVGLAMACGHFAIVCLLVVILLRRGRA